MLLGGCVTSGPSDSATFGHIEAIGDLEGTYRNLGEGGGGTRPVYLSALIWPDAADIDHAAVVAVEVKASGSDTLCVKALGKDGTEKEGAFVEGKDFVVDAGRIRLKQVAGIAGFKVGEPLVGPYYESIEIGLDERGHGKYRQRFSAAGLAFLVIPIAVDGSDEVLFVKIGDVAIP